MLGGDGYSEDSPRVYAGLSDATAVPETETITDGGWEPAIVINYPVEPSMHDEAVIDSPEPEEHSAEPLHAHHRARIARYRRARATGPASEPGRSDRRST